MRSFVALPLNPELIGAVQKLQQSLPRDLPNDLVRWTRADQLHLTLKFFGSVAEDDLPKLAAALKRACLNIPIFNLRFSQAGCFPSVRQPRVVWLGLEGDLENLKELHRRVEQETKEFGSHFEERDFRPHLTIGRVKGFHPQARRLKEILPTIERPTPNEWIIREVNLMQSKLSPDGSTYTELDKALLRSD